MDLFDDAGTTLVYQLREVTVRTGALILLFNQ